MKKGTKQQRLAEFVKLMTQLVDREASGRGTRWQAVKNAIAAETRRAAQRG